MKGWLLFWMLWGVAFAGHALYHLLRAPSVFWGFCFVAQIAGIVSFYRWRRARRTR